MIRITPLIIIFVSIFIGLSCSVQKTNEELKAEVFDTEKAFEKLCADSGIAVGFMRFADEKAIILRGNDSIIKGKEAIGNFYKKTDSKTSVSWTPDFIDVSKDGSLAYTYGGYILKIQQDDGTIKEFKGVFHTVWKRQKDGSWKYVWD